MAATFGDLNLEELGVVGNPEVQYARFETEVSEPKGLDGGVLANFRRGATTIRFDITLDGTPSEITGKINALTKELSRGQRELVLPNMTEGYHFDAAANGALAPKQYIDGFVLPLEFIVPEGLAVRETEIACEQSNRQFRAEIPQGLAGPRDWRVEVEATSASAGRNWYLQTGLRTTGQHPETLAAVYHFEYGSQYSSNPTTVSTGDVLSVDSEYFMVSVLSGSIDKELGQDTSTMWGQVPVDGCAFFLDWINNQTGNIYSLADECRLYVRDVSVW